MRKRNDALPKCPRRSGRGDSRTFYFTSNGTFGAVLAPASAEKRAFGEAPANPATRFVGNWRMVVLNA